LFNRAGATARGEEDIRSTAGVEFAGEDLSIFVVTL
jgi:hypothetical protein